MEQDFQQHFSELWDRYFPGAELPIAFYYADEPGQARKPRPGQGSHCLICDLAQVRHGQSLAFSDGTVRCGGGKRFLGFRQEMRPSFPYFLSYGIPGEMEGERYKKSPELVEKLMQHQPPLVAPGRYVVFKRWDRLDAGDEPAVVIFFATPDVLAGLFTLANYDEADPHGVVAPMGSGCSAIVYYPFREVSSDHPRAVLGMFDVSARPCVPAGVLTFAVPWEKFVRMVGNMEESFLITASWNKVRARIRKDPFTLRPFRPEEDLPRLARLRAEIEAADHDGVDTSAEALRNQMGWPGHDPAQDRWVVEAPDDPARLIAHSLVWVAPAEEEPRVAETAVYVHPDWRRRGLGSALAARTMARARALQAARASAYASGLRPGTDAFLQQQGFAAMGAYTEMRASGDLSLEAPAWPAGYQVRSYAAVADLPTLVQAMNRCYEGQWGHHVATAEMMAGWLPEWKPQGLFLVFGPAGEVVGISRVELSKERTSRNSVPTGYIDSPGLLPELRQRDLYRALLLTGMNWLRDQGAALVELESWGDRPETLDLYRETGFAVVRQVVSYQRELG